MATAKTTSAKKAEAAEKKPYTALVPIDHDADHYAPGDPIELTDTEATPLLAVKAVEAAKA
ncbi:MAG: hypothetical protein IIZ92_28480 [Aquincola sp.]|nr:hypothetical protein [Aquincola sp.]